MKTTPVATHTSDFSGLRCPHLLLVIIKRVRELEPNNVLKVTTTDLTAPSSISAWAGQCGHEILDLYQEGETFVFYLKVAGSE